MLVFDNGEFMFHCYRYLSRHTNSIHSVFHFLKSYSVNFPEIKNVILKKKKRKKTVISGRKILFAKVLCNILYVSEKLEVLRKKKTNPAMNDISVSLVSFRISTGLRPSRAALVGHL